MTNLIKALRILLLTWIPLVSSWGWSSNLSLGYGKSQEAGYDYAQHGFLTEAQFFPFAKLDKTLLLGLGASLAHWRADTETNQNMVTAACSAVFRAYFIPPTPALNWRPYLTVSIGPTYLVQRKLGEREQGSHLSLQTIMGAGSEVKIGTHDLDLSFKFVHYCNGGLVRPNQGIDIWYIVALGYLF